MSPSLDRLGKTGVPIDETVWLHACALHRASKIEAGKSVVEYDAQNWPQFALDVRADGRVHPDWTTSPGVTRIVAHGIPIQGIPKGVMREAVRAPGSLIVTADWSASHLRILASASGDERLIADCAESDPYSEITIALGLDPANDRKAVKTAILAAINGQGMRARWEHLPYSAHRLVAVMAIRWPVAMAFLDGVRADAVKNHGRIVTPAGTVLLVPADKHHGTAGYWLQGTEADALRRVIDRLHALEDAGMPLRLVATIHDEVVVECPSGATDPTRTDLVCALVADAMASGLAVRPELRPGAAKVTSGPSWGQQDGTVIPRALPDLPPGVEVPEPRRAIDDIDDYIIATAADDYVPTPADIAYMAPLVARYEARQVEAVLIDPRLADAAREATTQGLAAAREIRASWRSEVRRRVTDAEKEHETILTSLRAHGGVPTDAEVATITDSIAAIDAGRLWLARWQRPCGWSQAIADVATGQMIGVDRRCNRLDCRLCGPILIARKAEAIWRMPVTDPDGGVVGSALRGRDQIYRFDLDATGLDGWIRRFQRVSNKINDLQPSVADASIVHNGYIDASATLACKPTQPLKNRPSYVVFRKDGDQVTILSTLDCGHRRRQKGQTPETVVVLRGRDLRDLVHELTQSAYQIALTPDGVVVGGHSTGHDPISSSRGLRLDPDAIARLASGSTWVAERARIASVEAMREAMADHDVSVAVTRLAPTEPVSRRAAQDASHDAVSSSSWVPAPTRVRVLDACSRRERGQGSVDARYGVVFGFDDVIWTSSPEVEQVIEVEYVPTAEDIATVAWIRDHVHGDRNKRLAAEWEAANGAGDFQALN